MLVRAAREAMRCRFELVLDGGDGRFLRAAAEEALDEIGLWERRLSRFRRDSLVAHLERHAVARPVVLDPELFELFACATEVHRASAGAFDLAHRTGGELALDPVRGTVQLLPDPATGASPQLDLGAIGKGFAIDRAVGRLRELEVERALLHGGTSSVFALGAPPDLAGWRVAFAGLDAPATIELRDAACSVSAQHGRRLPDGSGHVRDPRAGLAAEGRAPVAVRAPTATLADAWSTALLVDPSRLPAARAFGVEPLTRTPDTSA